MRYIVLPEWVWRPIPEDLANYFRETDESFLTLFFWLYFFTNGVSEANDQLFMVLSETDWSAHVYEDAAIPDFQLQAHRLFTIYVDFHRRVDPFMNFLKVMEEHSPISDFHADLRPGGVVVTLEFYKAAI